MKKSKGNSLLFYLYTSSPPLSLPPPLLSQSGNSVKQFNFVRTQFIWILTASKFFYRFGCNLSVQLPVKRCRLQINVVQFCCCFLFVLLNLTQKFYDNLCFVHSPYRDFLKNISIQSADRQIPRGKYWPNKKDELPFFSINMFLERFPDGDTQQERLAFSIRLKGAQKKTSSLEIYDQVYERVTLSPRMLQLANSPLL